MKIHQLSLFLENRPGQLVHPCRILAKAGVNMLTATLADTQQFGILRFIVKEPEHARKILQDAGCVVNLTEVVAVDVADRPGGLRPGCMADEQHEHCHRNRDQSSSGHRSPPPVRSANPVRTAHVPVTGDRARLEILQRRGPPPVVVSSVERRRRSARRPSGSRAPMGPPRRR